MLKNFVILLMNQVYFRVNYMNQINFIKISSVLKKIIIAITGLSLFLFLIVHLLGNITLFTGNPPGKDFNEYAHFLESFGILFTVAEFGLLAFFLVHLSTALYSNLINSSARNSRYEVNSFAGGKSKKTYASSTMVFTGVVLMAFLIWHVLMFRLGTYYDTTYLDFNNGQPIRDLYRLVTEEFTNLWVVIGYSISMILLSLHLGHGFWSSFQSLGIYGKNFTRITYSASYLLGTIISVGFLIIPIYIYFIN